MLCVQIAAMQGAVVRVVARVTAAQEAAILIAVSADAALPVDHLIACLRVTPRVRALHATVLRRIESFAEQDGRLFTLPVGDALEEAIVLIAGRGPLYHALSVIIGERAIWSRDIDGIVVGDGFSLPMGEAFLTVLAQEPRFRDIPAIVIGEMPVDFTASLPNCDVDDGDPDSLVPRLVPLVRQHAFKMRIKRMLVSLDAHGVFRSGNRTTRRRGVLARSQQDDQRSQRVSQAFSMARLSLEGPPDDRAVRAGVRLLTLLIRNIDFDMCDDDSALLIVFTQTDLRNAPYRRPPHHQRDVHCHVPLPAIRRRKSPPMSLWRR